MPSPLQAAPLKFHPIPDFVFNQDADAYVIEQVGKYLVNPMGVTLSVQGFGGISASIANNILTITQAGTLTAKPYVVLTATRGTEVVKAMAQVRFVAGEATTFRWQPIPQVTIVTNANANGFVVVRQCDGGWNDADD